MASTNLDLSAEPWFSLGGIILRWFRFSDPATELAVNGSTARAIRELGSHYDTYHQEIAVEYERSGGLPSPKSYANDYDGYTRACSYHQELLAAEILLRRSKAIVSKEIASFDAPLPAVHLVDVDDRLVHVDAKGVVRDPPGYAPVPAPDWDERDRVELARLADQKADVH